MAQSLQQASYERGLPRSERPLEPNNVSGREATGEGRAERLGGGFVGQNVGLYFCLSGTQAVVRPPTVSRTISPPTNRSAPFPPPQRCSKSQVSGNRS